MTTERILDTVIKHVQEHARFIPDAPVNKYFVRYPNPCAGTFFCAIDTKQLVIQVMADKHPRASMRGY